MNDLETWTYKNIENFYNRVRAVLHNISDVSLPDKYIDMPEKATYSELYAKLKVPNWGELEESKFLVFESAIVYKTASLFQSLVASKAIKKKQLPTILLEYFKDEDVDVNGYSLSEWADILLSSLIDEEPDFMGFIVTQ